MLPHQIQTKPPIPWLGGKRRLLKHIKPLIPEHQFYVELFFGGGALTEIIYCNYPLPKDRP